MSGGSRPPGSSSPHVTSSPLPTRSGTAPWHQKGPLPKPGEGLSWATGQRSGGRLGLAVLRLAALVLVEGHLAHADGGRRDLHALILGTELQRLLQVQDPRRDEPLELLSGRGPHVGELLLLGDVDVHVVGPGVL